ncbi:uncharacterized protein LOC124898522 [Capsicum annuum]|uniref:uncharacterized protein LOC124898522 n=1 Tax=Capsicum annuum TaxID=4072 RepID=UPI001FB054F7|nr:uncharacterized protein LOC124898522 [Capsicum annuum]
MIEVKEKNLDDQINIERKQSESPGIGALKSLKKGDKLPMIIEEKGDEKETPKVEKKDGNAKIKKFLANLSNFSINIPLLEALQEISGYAKSMKILMSKKRLIYAETIEVTHSCCTIMSNSMAEKKKDPSAFPPCTIGTHKFDKALCDLCTSINLMPYAVYQSLGLGASIPTTMILLMVDRSIKKSIGVLYNVLVKFDKFILLVDFVVLDYEIDHDIPIIHGRPFLAIERALVDMEHGERTFLVYSDGVLFWVYKAEKKPSVLQVVLVIDIVDKGEEVGSSQLKYPA